MWLEGPEWWIEQPWEHILDEPYATLEQLCFSIREHHLDPLDHALGRLVCQGKQSDKYQWNLRRRGMLLARQLTDMNMSRCSNRRQGVIEIHHTALSLWHLGMSDLQSMVSLITRW